MPGDKTKLALKATNKARGDALRLFQERFPDEWDEILGKYRVEFGLPRDRRGPSAKVQVTRLEAEVAELRRQLAERSASS
jgi:hypothetical protein